MNLTIKNNRVSLEYIPDNYIDAMYVNDNGEQGYIFDDDEYFADLVYRCFGDTKESRDFIMNVLKIRSFK